MKFGLYDDADVDSFFLRFCVIAPPPHRPASRIQTMDPLSYKQQCEVMVRTLVDGSFARNMVQPANLQETVPFRDAVSGITLVQIENSFSYIDW